MKSQTEVSIKEVPAEVRESILAHSPRTTTVMVEQYIRKGVAMVAYAAGKGSPDGFPFIARRA